MVNLVTNTIGSEASDVDIRFGGLRTQEHSQVLESGKSKPRNPCVHVIVWFDRFSPLLESFYFGISLD